MVIQSAISYINESFQDHRRVLKLSVIFLVFSLLVQSYIWVSGGYNGVDLFAYEYTAKITIENDYNWVFVHPANNIVNPHSPVVIYMLIALYTILGSWLFTWIALLFINAFVATYFIYKLGLNITNNKLISSYITLLFVTIRSDGGYHGILFPVADIIGFTFIIITLYFLTLEEPRYYLASISTFIVMISHLYAGLSLFLLLIIFLSARLLSKDRIKFLKKYTIILISTIPGLLYYYYLYVSFNTANLNFNRGSDLIIEASLKYYNIMELPALYGFLHFAFAFAGILLIVGRINTVKDFLKNYKISSLIIWSLLLLAYSQAFFLFNILPNYRFLLYPTISLAIFGGIGLDMFMKKIIKSNISKIFFYLVVFICLFVTPMFYNVFAMDSAIDKNQAEVLNYINEYTDIEDAIFTTGSVAIYFTDITERNVGISALSSPEFDRIERMFLSLDLETAKSELIKNNIRYVYLSQKAMGEYFKKIPDVKVLYEKEHYYFFELS
jgi:hypothetical protein